jgi:hypothetical protein
METQTNFWDLVEQYLDMLPEEGPLARGEVEAWAWWHLHMVNVLEERGFTYRGASIRYDGWSTFMVVKAKHEDTPLVVFITERSTTHCMRAFKRMCDEGDAKWVKDKFA